ncbi:serine hydrolase domain-containing protein [Streptomyces sp. B6B3]|uniref:serine hydrolase domain-containing protein n=1 Tax=Streptomyces sp. B6B3 TaxID=3153570 RepID=UPI00325D0D1F
MAELVPERADVGAPAAPAEPAGKADVLGLGEAARRLVSVAVGATAVAVAATRGDERGTVCLGRTAAVGGAAAGPATGFDLASLSKTCTALLLADAHLRGEVRLDEPIARHLPPGERPHRGDGGRITPLHLATHTAGLSRQPLGLLLTALPRWTTLPYSRFTADHLRRAAARSRPWPAPGRYVRYSNHGVGLLGTVLAEATGESYEHLLATRVCAPLGLRDTVAVPAPPAETVARPGWATGHRNGRPLPPMTAHGLPAAGGVVSSARDMLRFLEAHLRPATSPLAAALAEVRRPRLALPRLDQHLALVWNVRRFPDHDMYFHSGGDRGFATFAGFSPQADVALVALANAGPGRRAEVPKVAYGLLRGLVDEALAAR